MTYQELFERIDAKFAPLGSVLVFYLQDQICRPAQRDLAITDHAAPALFEKCYSLSQEYYDRIRQLPPAGEFGVTAFDSGWVENIHQVLSLIRIELEKELNIKLPEPAIAGIIDESRDSN
ncbi:MAG TPA: hypothetical protein VG866_02235 [Candidatus Paceibacterota bacterium]|nr:hypothetical protein [Candidatus Paceibacterota bacterium]